MPRRSRTRRERNRDESRDSTASPTWASGIAARRSRCPQMIARAKEYGYDGIEIDGKRPHGNPLDWPTARCRDLRSRADGEGIDIYAVAANNDFSNPVPEVREAQICYRPRPDPHDGRPRRPDPPRVPRLVGRDPPPAARHLRHRRGLLADRPREVLRPRRSGAGAARPWSSAPATPATPGSRSPSRTTSRSSTTTTTSCGWSEEVDSPHLKALPRRPAHARPEHRRHPRGGAGGRPAPGAHALRRRVRAPARRLDPRLRAERRRRRRGDEPVLPRLRPRR